MHISKATKEELTIVLKRILKQESLKDILLEIDEISDEYNLDLTEVDIEELDEPIFDDNDKYLDEDEIEDLGSSWDIDDEDEF